MIYAYPCEFTPDEDGGLVVLFPDVPEAITGGKDKTEALMMAEDALVSSLEDMPQIMSRLQAKPGLRCRAKRQDESIHR